MLRGFYAICDVGLIESQAPDVAERVRLRAEVLLAARPCMLQLRAKHGSVATLWRLAQLLKPMCAQSAVPFCVNDRLDVALAVNAEAVHLGQEDLPLLAAQAALKGWPGSLWIGVSTHDETQAANAVASGAHYIGFGPVFPTLTKQNADPVVGLERLSRVVQLASIPVVGIGGISLQNVDSVVAAGASAAAVISSVWSHPDPLLAARLVNQAFVSRSGR